jgi:hypothetical protein
VQEKGRRERGGEIEKERMIARLRNFPKTNNNLGTA